MTSQIASMLVVVEERDFSQGVRSTQGDTGEGKAFHFTAIYIESYEFLKPLSHESDELIVEERDDDCKSLSTISHPSKYQIG